MPLEFPLSAEPPLLDVRDLVIHFGTKTAVQGLDLCVRRGETLALVGESGCGKSATALSILGLLPAVGCTRGGSILFEGQELLALPQSGMRHLRGGAISMIFQEPMTSLNPVLTIGRQIGEVLRVHRGLSAGAARARAIELLDLVRIPNAHRIASEFPHNLSGGMRQRVMIAIAVACQPRLLIADEPTTALDVTIQAQVLELLDQLRRDLSMGLLLITHDLGLVAEWADRVVVMYSGRKCEEGPVDRVLQNPMHPYTRGLMACSPKLDADLHFRDGRLPEIPGNIASAAGVAGCPFAPRCESARADCWVTRPDARFLHDPRHLLACPVHEPADNARAIAVH